MSKKQNKSRLFSNLPSSIFNLPENDSRNKEYQMCNYCQIPVHKKNKHCMKCKKCVATDGKEYRHCDSCEKCVKSNWEHCNACQKCVNKENHPHFKLVNKTSSTQPSKVKKKRSKFNKFKQTSK